MAGETMITLIGNATADPELRYTQNGLPVVNFTIAATERTFDRQANEFKDGDTLFIRASAFREMAEHIAATIRKGTRVIAYGKLKMRPYEKDGEKRTSTELEIEEVGPSLRYATAQVTRSQGGGGQRGGQPAQGAPQMGAPQLPQQGFPQQQMPPQQYQQPAPTQGYPQQAQPQPQQGFPNPGTYQPPAPGQYGDDTPF